MGSQGGTMGTPCVGSLSLLGLRGPLGLLDPWASLDPRASWHPREPRGQGPWRGCGALSGSDPATTLQPEPVGRSTPLSRANPLDRPGHVRTIRRSTPLTPCHTPPHLTSPHHASPRLVITSHHARPGQSDRFGWIWHPKLGFKIHQNRQKIDIHVHSILDCIF